MFKSNALFKVNSIWLTRKYMSMINLVILTDNHSCYNSESFFSKYWMPSKCLINIVICHMNEFIFQIQAISYYFYSVLTFTWKSFVVWMIYFLPIKGCIQPVKCEGTIKYVDGIIFCQQYKALMYYGIITVAVTRTDKM